MAQLDRRGFLKGSLLQASAGGVRGRTFDARVQALIRPFRGTVWIYAKNLVTGRDYGLRGSDKVRTASTIKLPIMAAAFRAVEQGRARWDEEIVLREEDKREPSGVLQEFTAGTRFRLRDLMHLMIVISDNTATNLMLDRMNGNEVNAFLDELGLPNTRVLRKIGGGSPTRANDVEANKPYGIGMSTPRDMVTLLEKISREELVSADASREMLAILRRQQYKEGIGRHLPDEAVASKSGSLDALRSDVGLVETKRGRVAIAITVDRMPSIDYSPDNAGSKLIWELTQMLLKQLT